MLKAAIARGHHSGTKISTLLVFWRGTTHRLSVRFATSGFGVYDRVLGLHGQIVKYDTYVGRIVGPVAFPEKSGSHSSVGLIAAQVEQNEKRVTGRNFKGKSPEDCSTNPYTPPSSLSLGNTL